MSLRYFDTHCHLQDERFGDEVEAVLERAQLAGVTHLVCCGTQESDWEAVGLLSKRFPNLVPMMGLHPWYLEDGREGWLDRLEGHLNAVPAGLGECGLDFALENADHARQEGVFRAQLHLACRLDRPVSIHCRRAWESLLSICRETGIPKAGAVVHAFSGSAEVARDLQSIGFYISFACSLVNPDNKRGAKALLAVRDDRLLFETDAPDIPPRGIEGFRDSIRNEPANIRLVATTAARLRGQDVETLSAAVYANALRVFGSLLAP